MKNYYYIIIVALFFLLYVTTSFAAPVLLSQDKPITGSGYFGDGTNPAEHEIFPFENANDGQFNDTGSPDDWSFWLTGHNEIGYIIIDLLAVFNIDYFMIQNTHNRDFEDRATKDFRISLSTDGSAYTTVVDDRLDSVYGTGNDIPWETFDIDPTSARFVMFNVDSYYLDSGGINELQVYGEPTPLPAAIWLFGSGLIGLLVSRRKVSIKSLYPS